MKAPKITRIIGATAPLLALGIMMHPHRAAAQGPQKEWRMRSDGGNCLGVASGQVTVNAPVVVWPCTGNPDQVGWTAGSVAPELHGIPGVPGTPNNAIVSWATPGSDPNLCIGAGGASLVMVPCNGGGAISWIQDRNGGQIKDFNNRDVCLDADHGSSSVAVERSCGAALDPSYKDQYWTFTPGVQR